MKLLDRIKEATIDNILFMFFAYSLGFMATLIVMYAWFLHKGIL